MKRLMRVMEYQCTRSDADYQKYLDAKRAASDSIALEKSRFYADKFDNCNAKDMYRTVNELLNAIVITYLIVSQPLNLLIISVIIFSAR